MGKRKDLQNKRRLYRLIKRKKQEQRESAAQREERQALQAKRNAESNKIESADTYYALFGIIITLVAFIDWLALSTFSYEVISNFGIWKSLMIFMIYVLATFILIPKSGSDLFRTLIGLSITSFPLLIIGNTIFSGVYEQSILHILLCTVTIALLLSCLIYMTNFSALNGLWLVTIMVLAIPLSVYSVGNWLSIKIQAPMLVAASIFALIVGFYWTGSKHDYPRSLQTLLAHMITIHVRLVFAVILILTNVWIILFLL